MRKKDEELYYDVNELRQSLLKYIKGKVRSNNDAEDILQDVFLKVQKNKANIKNVKNIESWIFVITRNSIIDYYKKKRMDSRLINLVTQKEETHNVSKNSVNLNKEISKCIKNMVYSLPEIYKEAIVEVEYKDHSQVELASMLNISLSGAKSRVQRGREKVKNILLQCCQIETDYYGNVVNFTHKTNKCKFC
jgi:RNA polymerase sigma-70 factor (ECF subfamily)